MESRSRRRPSVPNAFKLLGLDVIAHDDQFEQTATDDMWLTVAGEHGWLVITKDDRIRRNEAERAALIGYNVGCFVLSQRNATRWQMAQTLMRAWEAIEQIATTEQRPFLYAVHPDGSLSKRSLS